jgi:hypothetical protein
MTPRDAEHGVRELFLSVHRRTRIASGVQRRALAVRIEIRRTKRRGDRKPIPNSSGLWKTQQLGSCHSIAIGMKILPSETAVTTGRRLSLGQPQMPADLKIAGNRAVPNPVDFTGGETVEKIYLRLWSFLLNKCKWHEKRQFRLGLGQKH